MPLYDIPTDDLIQLVNPLDGRMWKCAPILPQEVLDALALGRREQRAWSDGLAMASLTVDEARAFHIDRIATLMLEPDHERLILVLENHETPIKGYLNDGNHRLAAAHLRNDATVRVLIASAVPEKIQTALPTAVLVAQP